MLNRSPWRMAGDHTQTRHRRRSLLGGRWWPDRNSREPLGRPWHRRCTRGARPVENERRFVMVRWSMVAVPLALAACGGGDGTGGRPSSGDMGQMQVTPECGALSQACIAQGLDAPLALGSALELTVEYKV